MASLKIQVVSSAAAFGLTLVARKVLEKTYKSKTGNEPPQADNLRDPIVSAVAWAALTAALAATIEAVIKRKAVAAEAAAIGAQAAPARTPDA